MSTQPEALRLADLNEHLGATKTAAELRRLYEVNHVLLEALKKAVDIINGEFPEPFQEGLSAIAKATVHQP